MGLVGSVIEGMQHRLMQVVVHSADEGVELASVIDDLGNIGESARPIVVQGGYSTDGYMYEGLVEMLRTRGFADVTATHLPWHGFAPIQHDAQALREAVRAASERSLAAGGDGKVTVIAHSKGGLASRWMLQRLGGAADVGQLVTLGSPHNGVAPFGERAARVSGMMPGLKSSKQLLSGSRVVRALNAELRPFMRAARDADPSFRIVSIAGDLGGAMSGSDGLVSVGAARMDDTIDGIYNLVAHGEDANHLAIAGQTRAFEPTLRGTTLLAAGRPVHDAARGAGLTAVGAA